MSRFLQAATFITAAQALAFDGIPARATKSVVPDATYHRPEVTNGPSIKELLRRQTGADDGTTVLFAPDNTCGYVSGSAGKLRKKERKKTRERKRFMSLFFGFAKGKKFFPLGFRCCIYL